MEKAENKASQTYEWAMAMGVIVHDPLYPEIGFLNPDWLKVMTDLEDAVWDLIDNNAETPEDAMVGLGTISYTKWRGEATGDDIRRACDVLYAYYKSDVEQDMKEFLASLRLGERVKLSKG